MILCWYYQLHLHLPSGLGVLHAGASRPTSADAGIVCVCVYKSLALLAVGNLLLHLTQYLDSGGDKPSSRLKNNQTILIDHS